MNTIRNMLMVNSWLETTTNLYLNYGELSVSGERFQWKYQFPGLLLNYGSYIMFPFCYD